MDTDDRLPPGFPPQLDKPHLYQRGNFIESTHYDPYYLWQCDEFVSWWLRYRDLEERHHPIHERRPRPIPKHRWDALRRWEQGAAVQWSSLDALFVELGHPLTLDTLDHRGWLIRGQSYEVRESNERLHATKCVYVSALLQMEQLLVSRTMEG